MPKSAVANSCATLRPHNLSSPLSERGRPACFPFLFPPAGRTALLTSSFVLLTSLPPAQSASSLPQSPIFQRLEKTFPKAGNSSPSRKARQVRQAVGPRPPPPDSCPQGVPQTCHCSLVPVVYNGGGVFRAVVGSPPEMPSATLHVLPIGVDCQSKCAQLAGFWDSSDISFCQSDNVFYRKWVTSRMGGAELGVEGSKGQKNARRRASWFFGPGRCPRGGTMQSDRRRLWEKAIRMDRRFMEALRRARFKRRCSNNRKGQRRRLLYYRGLFDGGDGTGGKGARPEC